LQLNSYVHDVFVCIYSDEIKQLMTSGKPLTAAETKHIQELMKAGKRDDCDFLFAFHDVYDAVSFALTFQVSL
jgi:hypothetical protein